MTSIPLNDMAALAEELREYTAMKYAGDCKCGKCQLVPRPLVGKIYHTLNAASRAADLASGEVVAWRDIKSAPRKTPEGRDIEIIVTGGTRRDQSYDYSDWLPFDDIALACYDSSLDCWRGEQTEQYGQFILHKPTHWMPKEALGKPGDAPAPTAPVRDGWNEAIEAAIKRVRDTLCAMEWPPSDGDRLIDRVQADLRSLARPSQPAPESER